MKILLVSALLEECSPLLGRRGRMGREGVEIVGKEGIRLCVAVSGVGVERAFQRSLELMDRFEPDLVISAGSCGALSGEFSSGEVVMAEEVVDERSGETFPCDRGALGGGFAGLKRCRVVTVKRPVFHSSMRERYLKRFGVSCVEMEASGVARASLFRGLPFLAIKVVTDHADLDSKIPPEILLNPAIPKSKRLFLLLVKDPAGLLRYIRFRSDFREGARRLGRFFGEAFGIEKGGWRD